LNLTKSQIDKAGRILRHWSHGQIVSEGVAQALSIVLGYRATYQYPLIKATMGLRSMVHSEGCRIEVSQRLKRLNTILDKLVREPTMGLSTMQDIGGCRAVLASIDEVRRVEHRLKKNRPPLGYYDYIAHPRRSGYRGVHVIVCYPDRNGDDREIEVQLRTRTMHEWAIAVERLSGRLKEDLKSSQGPAEVLELLNAVSEAMAMEERGETVPEALLARMRQLRLTAVPYLGGPP
jgi:putative GTP pyrophosphokinase